MSFKIQPTPYVEFDPAYDIGDTGPGGGKIFYISPGGFFSGTDGNEAICHYLEAWTTDLVTSEGSETMAWSATTNSSVTTARRIGAGRANTYRAILQNGTANRAVTLCNSFSNNGFSDWFLPSLDESDAMYFQKTVIGGFQSAFYWTSTELDATGCWFQNFAVGSQSNSQKTVAYRVRPVRSF